VPVVLVAQIKILEAEMVAIRPLQALPLTAAAVAVQVVEVLEPVLMAVQVVELELMLQVRQVRELVDKVLPVVYQVAPLAVAAAAVVLVQLVVMVMLHITAEPVEQVLVQVLTALQQHALAVAVVQERQTLTAVQAVQVAVVQEKGIYMWWVSMVRLTQAAEVAAVEIQQLVALAALE
jgi:hypothetical protein